MIYRLPKTRSMDDLLSAFENGMPLTRTSSDPNLNKHCQEGRSALEPSPAVEEPAVEGSNELIPDTAVDSGEGQSVHPTPEAVPGVVGAEEAVDGPCFTTQPLPSLPLSPVPLSEDVTLAHTAFSTPALMQALHQITDTPLQQAPMEAESPCRTAESIPSPTHKSEPCLPLPCKSTQPAANTPTSVFQGQIDSQSKSLLAVKQLTPLLPMGDSTETLTGENDHPPNSPSAVTQEFTQNTLNDEEQPEFQPKAQPQKEEEDTRTNGASGRERVLAAAPVDCIQVTARPLISQSQLSDLCLLSSHWESVQGLVQSASGASRGQHPNIHQSRRLASKFLRAQGFAIANGSQCCRREALCCPSSALQIGWPTRSAGYTGLCGPAALTSYSLAAHQLLPASYSSPSASSSPPPPQALAYLDDDGLPVPMDAVQQRLRQIEAGYKQEVEVLRQQVRQLQMRLESQQYGTPPSEPYVEYEDDIVSDFLSTDFTERAKSISLCLQSIYSQLFSEEFLFVSIL